MIVVMARKRTEKQHEGKLTSRAPRELSAKVRAYVGAVGDNHREMGRRMGVEDFLAALMLEFFGLEPPEQKSLLDRRLPELSAMYAQEQVDNPSVAADEVLGRGKLMPGIVVGFHQGVKDIDTKGKDKAAKRGRTPKRRS